MGEPATLSDEARGGPADDRWAGRGFLGLGPVEATETSTWRCLMCPQTGQGDSPDLRHVAEDHAIAERHIVVWDVATTFVPKELACG